MGFDNLVRRADLKSDGIPVSVIDRFEAENPSAVVKMNPLKRNSPRLYDKEQFEAWWKKDCKTQERARKMRTTVA